MESQLKTSSHNINNKKIFNAIDEFMVEVFSITEVHWENEDRRADIVEMIDGFMFDLAETSGKIIKYDVMCDRRNNTRSTRGVVNLTIKYVQKNCLNTSEINYVLTLQE